MSDHSDDVLHRIQRCCLGIVKDIDRVCRKNGIRYSLCAGSVIGAVLYDGFIPWDDDVDLMMERRDYDRFLRIYPEQAGSRYVLRHYSLNGVKNLPALFARVEDKCTVTTEQIAGAERTGRVFVDITVFDRVPDRLYLKGIRLLAGYTYSYLYRMNGMMPHTAWKRRLYSLVPSDCSEEALEKRYRKLEEKCRRFSGRKYRLCAELLSAAYGDIVYESRIFDQYRNVRFENEKLMMIRDYEDYLFMRYGRRNFTRDVPPEKRQKSHIIELEEYPEQ